MGMMVADRVGSDGRRSHGIGGDVGCSGVDVW